MEILRSFSEWFWNPDIWLPPGVGWEDVQPNEKVRYTSFRDMLYPIPFALCMIFVRLVIERTILIPLGMRLGIRKSNNTFELQHNNDLEKAYRKHKCKLTHNEMEALAKRTDMEVRQIERWLRKRSANDKHSTLAKFCECGFRWLGYATSVGIGFYVMWDKPWFWDISQCWYGFPHHSVPDDVWFYYVYGAGFYTSLLILHVFDSKRKDFWQMLIHHLTTLGLMAFSWVCNFTRVGTLVLMLHDCADVWLEIGKMCKYTKQDRAADVIFVIFTSIWIATRLVIFPLYIIKSTLIDAPKILPLYPVYYIFNTMLIMLLILSTIWTYYILRIVVKAVVSGKVEDSRSSSESMSEMSDSEENGSSSVTKAKS